MKLNRKLVLIAAVLMSVVMGTTGTIAYLSDTDSQVNVMTLGKVDIVQHEQERVTDAEGNVTLQDFTQGKPAYPMVGDRNRPPFEINGTNYGMHNAKNVVDKIVTVENTGKSDAYVRTFVAIEMPGETFKKVILNANGLLENSEDFVETRDKIINHEIDLNGVTYSVMQFTYKNPLEAGKTSAPSLLQLMLDSSADNADVELFGDTWDVLVLSQAVQTAGFEATADKTVAQNALDTAFGEVTEQNLIKWFGSLSPVNTVKTAAELQAALDAAEDGTTIVLGADIIGDVTVTQKENVKLTIEGANHKFDGVILVDGKSARYETAGVTIKNINFDAGDDGISADAFIRLGSNVDTNLHRYTNNVTVDNCTFTGDGIVAVKSYTGGDWNTTITGCTVNTGMHSLCQLDNVEKNLTITDCKVYSKNGANLNATPSLEMTGCTFEVRGYAVRFGADGTGTNAVIKNSTLTTDNTEGDAVIIFRGTPNNVNVLTLENTTLNGDEKIDTQTTNTTINGQY